jgi:hypothetical protein
MRRIVIVILLCHHDEAMKTNERQDRTVCMWEILVRSLLCYTQRSSSHSKLAVRDVLGSSPDPDTGYAQAFHGGSRRNARQSFEAVFTAWPIWVLAPSFTDFLPKHVKVGEPTCPFRSSQYETCVVLSIHCVAYFVALSVSIKNCNEYRIVKHLT